MADSSGEVLYLNALGQSILVLNSYEAARELLDKRSANYSDRPRSIMTKLCVHVLLFAAVYCMKPSENALCIFTGRD